MSAVSRSQDQMIYIFRIVGDEIRANERECSKWRTKRREPEYSAQWAMIRYIPTVYESVRYDVHESFAALTVSNFC